jgi:hypothetical protein
LCHTVHHFLHRITLIGEVTVLNTFVAIDLRLAAILLLTILVSTATGGLIIVLLFSNIVLPLDTCEPWLGMRNQQLPLFSIMTSPF